MAGATDSDEGNYWPGYVDALTAMVKVLTFVMMLLAVSVFAISQQVSRGAVEKIAKMLNVDATANGDLKNLTERVVDKLKTLPPLPYEPPQAAIPPPSGAQPLDMPPPPVEPQTLPPDIPVQPIELRPSVAPPIPRAEERQAEPKVDEARALESTAPPVVGYAQGPAKITALKEEMLLRFGGAIVKLDEATAAEVRAFAAGHRDKAFVLSAFAATGNGNVTVSRRVAFYRIMTVRQALVDAGIKPEQVRLSVRDSQETDQSGVVKLGIE